MLMYPPPGVNRVNWVNRVNRVNWVNRVNRVNWVNRVNGLICVFYKYSAPGQRPQELFVFLKNEGIYVYLCVFMHIYVFLCICMHFTSISLRVGARRGCFFLKN